MKKFAVLSLAVLLALPASSAGVNLGGYIDIGYIAAESDYGGTRLQGSGATNGTWTANDAFTVNEFNLDLSSQLTNDISAFASIDWTPFSPQRANAASLALDYAYVDIANPGPFDLNVRAGLIPSVTGIEQRVSESNQNRFINLSLLSPLMVGSNAGVAVYGSFSPINYALAVTNGDVMDGLAGTRDGILGMAGGAAGTLAGEYSLGTVNQMSPGASVGSPRNNNGVAMQNIANAENNNDKAISGRLGVVPIEGLELGLSYSLNDIATAGNAKNRTRKFIAADASYAYGPFSVKGEWISADEETLGVTGITSPKVEARGHSIELGYDLSSKVGFGARYSRVQTEQPRDQSMKNNLSTLGIAGVYRLADNVQIKAEYDINNESVLGGNVVNTFSNTTVGSPLKDIDNDVFTMSLVGSF